MDELKKLRESVKYWLKVPFVEEFPADEVVNAACELLKRIDEEIEAREPRKRDTIRFDGRRAKEEAERVGTVAAKAEHEKVKKVVGETLDEHIRKIVREETEKRSFVAPFKKKLSAHGKGYDLSCGFCFDAIGKMRETNNRVDSLQSRIANRLDRIEKKVEAVRVEKLGFSEIEVKASQALAVAEQTNSSVLENADAICQLKEKLIKTLNILKAHIKADDELTRYNGKRIRRLEKQLEVKG